MEIERKFLVNALPPCSMASPHSRIRQGYFALRQSGIEIRIREIDSKQFITIKSGRGKVRREEEIPILKRHFTALWPLVRAASISKIRYRISHGKQTVEVDAYQGPHRGLITAEVEFASRRQADSFKQPAWFGREITGVRRYANEFLARRGHL